jgi:hypothetical protein
VKTDHLEKEGFELLTSIVDKNDTATDMAVSGDTVSHCIKLLKASSDRRLQYVVVRFISTLTSSSRPSVVPKLISEGILDCLYSVIIQCETTLTELSMFAISNLVNESSFIAEVVANHEVFNKVLDMLDASNLLL